MVIRWFGKTFFQLVLNLPQNGESRVIIDPFVVKTIGLRQPKMEADLVLLTQGELDKKLNIKGDYFLISNPGEYEIRQIFVYGVPEMKDDKLTGRIFYLIEAEGISVVHLGLCSQTVLTDKQLEFLERPDILLLPVGGGDSLTAKQAAQLVQQLEPRFIVPMNFAFPGSKVKLDKVDVFVRELGKSKPEIKDKMRISNKDLVGKESELVVLNP